MSTRVFFLTAVFLASTSLGLSDGAAAGGCTPGPNTLCLLGGQFEVEIEWANGGDLGDGQVLPGGADGFGFFAFDTLDTMESLIQIVDACSINQRYWVLSTGLSSFLHTITITDRVNGVVQVYANPQGELTTFIDTNAFLCFVPPEEDESPALRGQDNTSSISLFDARFRIEADWVDAVGGEGSGEPVAVTNQAAYFWFFQPTDPQLAVKIVDGGDDNGFFQVSLGGPSSLEYTLRVLDLCTNEIRAYEHPQGFPGISVIDDEAFLSTPTCVLFADSFENGGFSSWSSVVAP